MINLPDLEWISSIFYKSKYGYFMRNENDTWVFLPVEIEFDTDLLMNITNILRNLNENAN
jgi:hypothetical protein